MLLNKFLKNANTYLIDLYKFLIALIQSICTILKGKRAHFHRHKNKTVLIMGNAPCLNNTDIPRLVTQGTDVVCVNWFPLKDRRFREMKPGWLCLIDPNFFTGNEAVKKDRLDFLRELEKVDWKLKIICVQGSVLPVKNRNISYVLLNGNVYNGNILKYFLYRHNLANCGMQNVVTAALYYFISVRVSRIYLAGVEMSEFKNLSVNQDNQIYISRDHSYGKEKFEFKKIANMEQCGMHTVLGMYQKMFEQFHEAAEYAERNHVKVYNLTPSSYLDMFEKTDKYCINKDK